MVTSSDLRAVLRVDPVTGNRRVISGCLDLECSRFRGRGIPFESPLAIAVEAAGTLIVVDGGDFFNAVVRVDPVTGDRGVLSGCVGFDPDTFSCGSIIGSGPTFEFPLAIALDFDGSLLVVDAGFSFNAVVRVAPDTGDRIIVSGSDAFTGISIGSGPTFEFPLAIALNFDGSLLIVDAGRNAVLRVDPVTGDRILVSGANMGSEPFFVRPQAIAIEAYGSLLIVDAGRNAVLRVDPVTGDRAVLSGCIDFDFDSLGCVGGIGGNGPSFSLPVSIAIEPNGFLVVVDFNLAAIVRVDPVTGDRTIILQFR